MRSSCIPHPEKEALVIIRAWQVEACDGNHCAAALLSVFEYWHNVRLAQSEKSAKQNDVAEMHGDSRTQDESLFQFHTEEDLESNLLGLYKRSSIRKAIALLLEKGFISAYSNPNPRYKFDRTRFFLLETEAVKEFLASRKNNGTSVKNNSLSVKNNSLSVENTFSSISQEITTEITSEINLLSHAEARDAIEHWEDFEIEEPVLVSSSTSISVSALEAGTDKNSAAQKTPQSKRKAKSEPTRSPAEFEQWWKIYYDFCLDVNESAGKRVEAAAAWDDLLLEADCLNGILEGTAHYIAVKVAQFKAKGEAKAVSHGIRYLRDRKWQEALDHKRRQSSSVAIPAQSRPLYWSDEWPQPARDDFENAKLHKNRIGLSWDSPELLDWVAKAQERGYTVDPSKGFIAGFPPECLAKLAHDLQRS